MLKECALAIAEGHDMLLFGLRRISASEVGFCHAPQEEGRKTKLRPDLGARTAPPRPQ